MKCLCIWFLAAGLSLFSLSAEGQTLKEKGALPTPTVPRPAPEFLWSGVNGKVRRLRDVRGHPVVLIFAENPNEKMFIKQIKELNRRSKQLAIQYTLFFVAFTRETGLVTRTDIPFVILPDPGSVADAYRVGDFGIAVIGPDGNVDYATDHVVTGQKVLDVIENSYAAQVHARRL
ncbi:MAG: redoxin domain-containing protein [Verrucomicrobia bacterium]|nr:redoxin domain-containing protein [Verrucomicrobiota bacterium]